MPCNYNFAQQAAAGGHTYHSFNGLPVTIFQNLLQYSLGSNGTLDFSDMRSISKKFFMCAASCGSRAGPTTAFGGSPPYNTRGLTNFSLQLIASSVQVIKINCFSLISLHTQCSSCPYQ